MLSSWHAIMTQNESRLLRRRAAEQMGQLNPPAAPALDHQRNCLEGFWSVADPLPRAAHLSFRNCHQLHCILVENFFFRARNRTWHWPRKPGQRSKPGGADWKSGCQHGSAAVERRIRSRNASRRRGESFGQGAKSPAHPQELTPHVACWTEVRYEDA